jgi:hypothetical protein
VVVIVGVAVSVVGVAGLGVQAVRGNDIVNVQRDARTIRDATLDDAFYHCIDVQTHSLVSPGEPVSFTGMDTLSNLGSVVTLLKASGDWLTFADPPSAARVGLTLRNDVSGRGACLGTVVVATDARSHHPADLRTGSGSSVPGHGPPPAPPL